MCFPLLVLSHPKRPTCQLWSILLSERGRSHWNWVTATGMSQCGCRSQPLRFFIPWMLMFFALLPNFCRRLTTPVKQNNEYGHQMARGPSPLFEPVDMGEDLVVVSHSHDQRNKWKGVKPCKIEHEYLNLHIEVFHCILLNPLCCVFLITGIFHATINVPRCSKKPVGQ